ncbi:MAG: hypothetical protein H6Q42_213 [Deltaproteobacteria bacterium]|nr:hypothetical protein [Deltaproteobacteria bacterium]
MNRRDLRAMGTQPESRRTSSPLLRWLLIIIGLVAVSVGTVGIFVPLLPTTPFYLLAAACFFRSSDRLYQWLIGNKWCGPYLRNYREQRAIPRHAKIVALILLWGTIGHAVLALLDHIWLRILMVGIAVGVTIYLLRLKTLKG